MFMLKRGDISLKILALNLTLFFFLKNVNCESNFKNSLTAYAEKKLPEVAAAAASVRDGNKQFERTKLLLPLNFEFQQQEHGNDANRWNNRPLDKLDSMRQLNADINYPIANTDNKFSLSILTKLLPLTVENDPTRSAGTVGGNRDISNSPLELRPYPKNNHTEHPGNHALFQKKPTRPENNKNIFNPDKESDEQRREKKHVDLAHGVGELLWNTGAALWSINRNHFWLPTFFHRAAIGKLSLLRNTIFNQISVLSQLKRGILQISNDKLKHLAHFHAGHHGWSQPTPEVYLFKLHPHHTHFLTLAKYLFRFGKHTTVTKYKLKRALLGLQLRAFRNLIRVLSGKSLAKKIAAIKVLTGAIGNGRDAVLHSLTGPSVIHTDSHGPYYGAHIPQNFDVLYSPFEKPVEDEWKKFVAYYAPKTKLPPTPAPPPPSYPSSSYYYVPKDPPQYAAPPASSPPSPDYYYAPDPADNTQYSLPEVESLPAPNTQYLPPQAPPPRQVLRAPESIEFTTPPAYQYLPPIQDNSQSGKSSVTTGRTSLQTGNALEAPPPATSYSYHASSPLSQAAERSSLMETPPTGLWNEQENKRSSTFLDQPSASTTPTASFSFKLLEAMNL